MDGQSSDTHPVIQVFSPMKKRLIFGFTHLSEPLGLPTNRIVLFHIRYLLKMKQNIVKLYYVFKIKR